MTHDPLCLGAVAFGACDCETIRLVRNDCADRIIKYADSTHPEHGRTPCQRCDITAAMYVAAEHLRSIT